MTHVTFVALPDSLGTSITTPLEMLNAAREIAQRKRRRRIDLTLAVAGQTGARLHLAGGLEIVPDTTLSRIDYTDLVFIPGLWRTPERFLKSSPRLPEWLSKCHARGSTLCSIGTGSYFLAQAGLLNNLPATTHWYYFDDFQRQYPEVKLQRGRFITLANRLYCTGSINAVRDVIIHLVEKLFDAEIADEVAHHFTHELKRSYESKLLGTQQQDTHHDELIIRVQEWLQKHYMQQIGVREVAARFKLSTRTLDRRFRQAANRTPLQYLQDIRIDQARDLLKQSNLSIAEICDRVGYHDHSYFAGLFRKYTGVTPSQYRNLVRSKLFSVE